MDRPFSAPSAGIGSPAIRDRNTGIWQKVTLSASGPAVLQDPSVTTDLALPGLDSADIAIQTNIRNLTDQPQTGVLKGSFDGVTFSQPVQLAASTSTVISLDAKTLPQLHLANPRALVAEWVRSAESLYPAPFARSRRRGL